MRNGEYELVIAPKDYPGRKYRGRYAYEHHVVWWRHFKTMPANGHVIHHKNGNKRDNRLENLELMGLNEHSAFHQTPAALLSVQCANCRCEFSISSRVHRSRLKQSQSGRLFCSKSCQVSLQQRERWQKLRSA